MTDGSPWHVTDRFEVEGVGVIPVERNGQLGAAKQERIPNEKLAPILQEWSDCPSRASKSGPWSASQDSNLQFRTSIMSVVAH